MNRGIVMEVSRRTAVIMTQDGRFLKLKVSPDVQIGQEIEVASGAASRMHVVRWMSVAAAVLLILGSLSAWSLDRVRTSGTVAAVAYVTIDINPSVEFGVDERAHVVEAVGINDEGRRLLREIDVLGREVEEATEELIVRAKPYIDRYAETGYGEIVIASTIVADRITLDPKELQEKVKSVVYRVVQYDALAEETSVPGGDGMAEQGAADAASSASQLQETDAAARQKPIKVAALNVPKEVREDAKEKGISAGKLAVGLIIADRTGREMPIADIASKSITQLVEENGWLESLLQQDQDSIRENLEQLYRKSIKGKSNIGLEKPVSWLQDDGSRNSGGKSNSGKGDSNRDDDRGKNSGSKSDGNRDDGRGKNGGGKSDGRRDDDRDKNSGGKSDGIRGDDRGKNGGGKSDGRRDDDRGKNSGGKGNSSRDNDSGKSNDGKSGSSRDDDRGKSDSGEGNGSRDDGRSKNSGGKSDGGRDDDRGKSNSGKSGSSRDDDRGKSNSGGKGNSSRDNDRGKSNSGKGGSSRDDDRGKSNSGKGNSNIRDTRGESGNVRNSLLSNIGRSSDGDKSGGDRKDDGRGHGSASKGSGSRSNSSSDTGKADQGRQDLRWQIRNLIHT